MNSIIGWLAGPRASKYLLVILMLGGGSLLAQSPPLRWLHPIITDHGVVTNGRVIESHLQAVNVSGQPLKIREISTTCGCTALAKKLPQVAPGDTLTIPYRFETAGYGGMVRKSITVHWGNKVSEKLIGYFQANVVQAVDADPRFFYFPRVAFRQDSSWQSCFKLSNYDQVSVTIDSVVVSSPSLSVEWDQCVLKAGQSMDVKVLFTSVMEKDTKHHVAVYTSHPGRPRIAIPFYVTYK